MVNRYDADATELVARFKESVDSLLRAEYGHRIALENRPSGLAKYFKSTSETEEEHALTLRQKEITTIATLDQTVRCAGNMFGNYDAVLQKYAEMGIPAGKIDAMVTQRSRDFHCAFGDDRTAAIATMGYAEALFDDAPLVWEGRRR